MALVIAVGLLPAFASGVYLHTGTVDTDGEPPLITKTGTLLLENELGAAIEEVQANLNESEEYQIVDGQVVFPTIPDGESAEPEDSYTVEIDTTSGSQSVPLSWTLTFRLQGETEERRLVTMLHVEERE